MSEPRAEFEVDTLAAVPKIVDVIRGSLTMLLASGPMRITIVPLKTEECSKEARGLYWIWMRAMGKHFSRKDQKYDENDMHDLMRHKFLGYERRIVGKTDLGLVLKSTKKGKITPAAMCEYMTKIDAWAADNGCLLPRPEDNEYSEWQKAAA